ncbi:MULTISPECIES: hypothetical protein [Empedobacter]|uniref:Uncharacterized protein n=2 Tax=Empedobacter TaxID=59734 RepID=A0A427BE33_9FLAO|nr:MULTISPECIES: hypothetical protein [Empedobacter]RRT86285.1 hypothetical protein EGI88_15215 [Empedobacter falsenii]RRT86942.1 hypothetical protein EGI89_15185 [Empedobacter falsenii]TGN24346.1 hypothetical protein E4J94_13980 [Empedobacter tilapiae]
METKKIKQLEFIRAKLQVDKKHAIYCKNYAKARNCHIRLKNINNSINQEQNKLWNYTLSVKVNTYSIDYLIEIYKYFDQINYKSLLYNKILTQLSIVNEEIDDLFLQDNLEKSTIKINELRQLREFIVEKELY